MGYTREEILVKCSDSIKDASTFYNKDFINYRGRTKDTKEFYTEVVAEFLCANLDKFKSISSITRKATYRVNSHDGNFSKTTNRLEEITAMKMFNQCKDGSKYDYIGRIIDYQTPLKNSMKCIAGKIDLISKRGKTLLILELKNEKSVETMLRCVLEGFTYLKILDSKKLINDFGLGEIEHIKASPLVFYKMAQWQEMQKERPQLKRLMELLDSVPYYIAEKNMKYFVMEEK